MFLEDLKKAAFDKCALRQDQPLLVGVSGGADSLALMFGLETLGFKLTIAHLDHGIRSDSTQDADFLQALATSRHLEFIRKRMDVRKAARDEGQSLEEAARHVRYQFLFEQAREIGAQAVAVGHHADDQVETVLMHFIRGSALPGLTGMSFRKVLPLWDARIPLVRPLLGIWREDIERFLADIDIEARIDVTNQDVTYFRNQLRHVLLPELENYNSQIRRGIWRMADVLGEEDGLLDALTQEAWAVCHVRQSHERIILNNSKFVLQAKAIQRRLLRYVISLLRPDLRDVGYDAIERGLSFAIDPSRKGEFDLVARLNIAKLDNYLIIKTWGSGLPDWEMPLLQNSGETVPLDVGQVVRLRHGWCLEARLLKDVPPDKIGLVKDLSPKEAWLDVDLLDMPLIVGGRQEGIRWQPLGMQNHTQKIKDFFINEKIPDHLRDMWPLVFSGDQVAWIAGLRPSEAFKITDRTKRILHLRLRRELT
jgi:tRNA(Ile)-lysidine synthase